MKEADEASSQGHRCDLRQMLKELATEAEPVIAGTTLMSQARIAELFDKARKEPGGHG